MLGVGAGAVSLLSLVAFLFQLFYVLLIIRVILSWVPGINYSHPAVQFVFRLTSPVLNPIRRAVPPVGGLDLSPVVAILLLIIVQRVVMGLLVQAFSY